MTPTAKRCSAKACVSSSNSRSAVPMFKFPRDLERCATWVKNAGNEKLLQLPSKRLCVRSYLCSKHFEEGHFFDKFKRRLKRNAIPTLFTSMPLSDKLMLKFPVSEDPLNALDDAANSCTLNILRNKYNSFSLPCSRETLNRMVSIQQSVKSNDSEQPGNADVNTLCITQDNSTALKPEGQDHGLAAIRVPSCESSTDVLNLMPGPGSITYIEGPWSNQQKFNDPISVEIFDEPTQVSSELVINGCHVDHSSDNTFQEIIVHHVDIKTDRNYDNSSDRKLMVPTTSPSNSTNFGKGGSQCPELPTKVSNQICQDTESSSSLTTGRHFVIQSKQLNNGGQVHVRCSAHDVALKH